MKRQKIVERAAEMFTQSGIKAIRMDDIANDLGVSKRTLYEMFEDKKELLYLAFKHISRAQDVRAAEAFRRHEGSLVAILESVSVMRESRESYNRMSNNLQKFYPDLYERLRSEIAQEGCQRLCNIIKDFISKGLILDDIDVDLSVTILYFTLVNIFSISNNNNFLPNNVSRSEAFFYTVVNFFRGIATMRGVEQIDAYVKERKLVKQNSNNSLN